MQPFAEKRWIEFHRTECIQNCHDPDFVKKVKIHYRFEEQQNLKFIIYDIDGPSARLEDHDYLGEGQCTLGQVVSRGTSKILLHGKPGDTTQRGYLLVVADEVSNVKDDFVVQFSGSHLDKMGWFGRSDPFLAFYKSTESGAYSLTHKTEVIKWNTSPKWKRFKISSSALCSGDWDRNIRVACWHSDINSGSNLIGEFYVTMNDLMKGPGEATVYKLVNPGKQKKPKYSSSGSVRLEFIEVVRNYSFLDYVKGGCQLNCSIAIDFTGEYWS